MQLNRKKSAVSVIAVIALVIIALFSLVGCGARITVTKIEQSADGSYTVTYSDGSTSKIETNGENGKNGNDGKDITVDDLFAAYKELHPDATLEEFLEKYLSFTTDSAAAINSCLRSSISIYTEFIETSIVSTGFGRPPTTVSSRVVSSGSGVIFKIDQSYVYAATNYHVVYDSGADTDKNGGDKFASKTICYLYGSEGYPQLRDENGDKQADTDDYGYVYDYGSYALPVEIIGGSATNDIAVIRIQRSDVDAIGGSVAAAQFALSYHVGQTAIAIGNPESAGISATQGIISVDGEDITLSVDGTSRTHRSMRIDTAIYHGSSGGGLFDSSGLLIGITNAGDDKDQNINYAVPLEIVRGTIDNIMYYFEKSGAKAKVKKVTLGITVLSENARYVYDPKTGYGNVIEDAKIEEVSSGSIASSLGLQSGDIVTAISVSGKEYKIYRRFNISDVLLTAMPTDTISVSYSRGGQAYTTAQYSLAGAQFNEIA